MPQFRKKPVTVEAKQVPEKWDGDGVPRPLAELLLWLSDPGHRFMYCDDGGFDIPTLEGTMHAQPGDWIIKGVMGEFYPCKNDIFAATYESADQTKPQP